MESERGEEKVGVLEKSRSRVEDRQTAAEIRGTALHSVLLRPATGRQADLIGGHRESLSERVGASNSIPLQPR